MKFFSVLLALFLASCGASVNFMQYGEQVSYTRTSSSIFIKNKSSVKKIFIVLQNGTPYSEFNDISDIIKTKIGNKYIVTDSVSDADLVIHLNVRQFTRIEPETMSNIEKYWQYTETTDNLTLSDINATTFGISHDGVVISDAKSGKINIPSGGSQKADQGIISKLATNDFLSGMSIGGLAGFWSLSSPVGATIGAMIGGTLSFVSQNSTKPKIYIATVDIEIGQKVDNQVVYEEKYLHRQDDNGMRWHNIKSTDNKNYMRTKMYAVTKRTLLDIDSASSILVEKIGEAIGNSL